MINYGEKIIKNKKIYIVEEHHHVIKYWGKFRKTLDKAPILITLDHHTDTLPCFNYKIYVDNNYQFDSKQEQKRHRLLSKVDINNENDLDNAIKNLRNDEHIDFAVKIKIISQAFIIAYQIPNNNNDRIYEIENNCYVGCNKKIHDNSCLTLHYNQAIESFLLNEKLCFINNFKKGLVENNKITKNYILDIDLDYFHTVKSIHPGNVNTFYSLIKNASIITIATEPWYVNYWKESGHEIREFYNSEYLLNELMKHIEQALK